MTSFEINKFVKAILGTVFVIFSIRILSDILFSLSLPEKSGYKINVSEYGARKTFESATSSTHQSALPLLFEANIEAGKAAHKKCIACHTFEKNGANKVGPNLWNIVNRIVASIDGFSYSVAMKNFSKNGSVNWSYENLDEFLYNPKSYIKGTLMVFAGISKASDRANLIAYLRTLSDNPAPLPERTSSPEETPSPSANQEKEKAISPSLSTPQP